MVIYSGSSPRGVFVPTEKFVDTPDEPHLTQLAAHLRYRDHNGGEEEGKRRAEVSTKKLAIKYHRDSLTRITFVYTFPQRFHVSRFVKS